MYLLDANAFMEANRLYYQYRSFSCQDRCSGWFGRLWPCGVV